MATAAGPLAGRHVLLGVAGGIAAYKAASLARALRRAGATVQVVLTASGARFVTSETFAGLTGRPAPSDVLADAHEVAHVAYAREADVAVFAPATANLLAKFANGLADDLPSAVFTCLTCPVVLAPAMHTEMWEHAATQANVELLAARGAVVVGPDTGALAGGDEGPGRLAAEDAIVAAVVGALEAGASGGAVGRSLAGAGGAVDGAAGRPLAGTDEAADSPLAGARVVVTAGGTREPIDPVRYIGNRSSGKMGHAIADEFARRGADVDLVTTAADLPVHANARAHHVETALEMREAVHRLAADAVAVVKAAAVADYRPAAPHAQKLKKGTDDPEAVALVRNPDILAELGADKRGRVLVGFAAETDLEEERGREKLKHKGLDLIVINRVDTADAGFGVDTNRALLLDADGGRAEVPLTTKARLAQVICDRVADLLTRTSDGPAAAAGDTRTSDGPADAAGDGTEHP